MFSSLRSSFASELIDIVADFSSAVLNENICASPLLSSSTACIVYSSSHSLSIHTSSSLHSPPAATTYTSRHVLPSLSQTIVISAIGESFRNIFRAYPNISSFSVSTSGVQSSIRNTFLPPSPRRAGSIYTISGLNSAKISSGLWNIDVSLSLRPSEASGEVPPPHTAALSTVIFSALSTAKLCLAASQSSGSISQ